MFIYSILFGVGTILSFIFAIRTYMQKNRVSLAAGHVFLGVAFVNLTYLLRIWADSVFTASVLGSLYFVSMDFLELNLLHYVIEFTAPKVQTSKVKFFVYGVADVAALADAVALMLNVKYEFEMYYEYDPTSRYLIKYMYQPMMAFNLHLLYCYLLIGIVAMVLIWKILSIPKIYRGRYVNGLGILFVIIVMNFLYQEGILYTKVDFAVILYACFCPIVYWNNFDYSSKTMLNSTRKMILEYMGTPMILFDYEGYVADANKDMRALFPILNNNDKSINMMDFLQIGAFKGLQNTNTDQVFEWQSTNLLGSKMYQCNFTCLNDEQGRNIGHLLLLKNLEVERDMLTQLYSKQSFYSRMEHIAARRVYPMTIVVCNTNGIGIVNDVYGWSKGNELIKRAADLMTSNLPAETILARMDDGDMVAGFVEVEQEYAVRLFENIREQFRKEDDTGINTDLEFGVAVIRDSSMSIEQAVKEAGESMRTKKMMNESSKKSALLDSLTQTLTESDYETEEHVERTKKMAYRLGQELKLSDADLGKLALLAVLHDIGKIAIPHSILLKPSKLTDEEWEIMKTHTEKGYRIASASKELQPVAEYILHHHERWDGKGYPGGLAGEEIPLLSRIITVVDSHDVMVHDRPYHKAMSYEAAVEELKRCSGTQFDPHLIEVFLKVIEKDHLEELEQQK